MAHTMARPQSSRKHVIVLRYIEDFFKQDSTLETPKRNLCNFNLHGLDLPTLPTPPALSAIEQPKSPRLKFKRALHPPLCIKIFVPGFIRKKQTCAHISAPPIFATKAGEKARFPNAMLCPSLDQIFYTFKMFWAC